jgi:hypothetical protein
MLHWPERSVESIPPDLFVPPHCPRERCPSNQPRSPKPFAFRRHGHFVRKCDSRRVPRFRCGVCRRTHSQQTFACSYYLKRPELSLDVAAGIVACSAHRQTARTLRCAPTTVTRRAARLGRHALLLHAQARESLGSVSEPVIYDHFETFAHSQEEPCGIGTPIGRRTWLLYGLDLASHRRTGRATPAQKARQSLLFRDAPRGDPYRSACAETLAALLSGRDATIDLHCDGKRSYLRAAAEPSLRDRIRMHVHPNPKRRRKGEPRSREAIVRDRALFPVDQLHRFLRHSLSHHRRETIAFGRRHAALMERAFLFLVWRNLVQRKAERHRSSPTPGMLAEIQDRPWPLERLLVKRLFPWREKLTDTMRRVYARNIVTRALPINARHTLKNAY